MKKLLLTLCATAAMASQAFAFSGQLLFQGTATAPASGAGSTTVTFANNWHTTVGTGAYTSVPANQAMTMSPITFTGTGFAAMLTAPVTPQWSFTIGLTTYSFDLTALAAATTGPAGILMLGTGTAHIGAESSEATWSLLRTGSSGTGPYVFKATLGTVTATGVPEGGSTVALLGLALTGLGVARRKFVARS